MHGDLCILLFFVSLWISFICILKHFNNINNDKKSFLSDKLKFEISFKYNGNSQYRLSAFDESIDLFATGEIDNISVISYIKAKNVMSDISNKILIIFFNLRLQLLWVEDIPVTRVWIKKWVDWNDRSILIIFFLIKNRLFSEMSNCAWIE